MGVVAMGGIRIHDRSRRAAVDLRLRPRGQWDRPSSLYRRHIPLSASLILPLVFILCKPNSFSLKGGYRCVFQSQALLNQIVNLIQKKLFKSKWVPGRGEFRPGQTRQLPRAVDLKGWLLSCQSY